MIYVKETLARLRATPQVDSEPTDEPLFGTRVDVLEQKPGWDFIRTEYGYEGWCPVSCLAESDWRPNAMVTRGFTDIQESPRLSTFSLVAVPQGGFVKTVGGDEDGWTPVETPDGRRGFVLTRRLDPMPQPLDAQKPEDFRAAVMKTALSYLGAPYRWGGRTTMGIDCSGLCFQAYWMQGARIWRDAAVKEGFMLRAIPREQAFPGDLIMFPGHVAMLLPEGRFVHSTGAGFAGVMINSLLPDTPGFRGDLLDSITCFATIF